MGMKDTTWGLRGRQRRHHHHDKHVAAICNFFTCVCVHACVHTCVGGTPTPYTPIHPPPPPELQGAQNTKIQ